MKLLILFSLIAATTVSCREDIKVKPNKEEKDTFPTAFIFTVDNNIDSAFLYIDGIRVGKAYPEENTLRFYIKNNALNDINGYVNDTIQVHSVVVRCFSKGKSVMQLRQQLEIKQ